MRLHGYSAHARRRETAVTGAGCTLEELRDHLLKVVPGLKDAGCSRTALEYMFCPPHKGRKGASRYKSYIPARVPCKRNDIRKKSDDAHYLFSRVKMRREFAQEFNDEVAVISCDDMTKLKVGGILMVSRYHQIKKFYPEDDSPEYDDHDYNLPGYLITPSGYMLLEFKDEVPLHLQAHSDNVYEEIQSDMESQGNILGDYAEKNLAEEVRAVLAETLENLSGNQIQVEKDKIVDSHGRLHYKTPHSGPAAIFLRAHLYQKSDINAHMNDLDPIVSMEIEKGKTVCY